MSLNFSLRILSFFKSMYKNSSWISVEALSMSYENNAVRRTNRVFGAILHKNQKIPRAASNVSTGRMRPAGRRLPTPGLKQTKNLNLALSFSVFTTQGVEMSLHAN